MTKQWLPDVNHHRDFRAYFLDVTWRKLWVQLWSMPEKNLRQFAQSDMERFTFPTCEGFELTTIHMSMWAIIISATKLKTVNTMTDAGMLMWFRHWYWHQLLSYRPQRIFVTSITTSRHLVYVAEWLKLTRKHHFLDSLHSVAEIKCCLHTQTNWNIQTSLLLFPCILYLWVSSVMFWLLCVAVISDYLCMIICQNQFIKTDLNSVSSQPSSCDCYFFRTMYKYKALPSNLLDVIYKTYIWSTVKIKDNLAHAVKLCTQICWHTMHAMTGIPELWVINAREKGPMQASSIFFIFPFSLILLSIAGKLNENFYWFNNPNDGAYQKSPLNHPNEKVDLKLHVQWCFAMQQNPL